MMVLSDKTLTFITDNKNNPFCLSVDFYKRDINVVSQYFKQLTFYLSTMTGDSPEEIKKYYKKKFSTGGIFEIVDPVMTLAKTKDNGDREVVKMKATEYLKECVQLRRIISPTFTVYENPKVKPSILSSFQDNNINIRNKDKKEMYRHIRAGNKFLALDKKLDQENRKRSNNAVSGGLLSASTPLYNKSGHPALTSTCRITSGLGNLNNEKIVMGNRYYYNAHIVINNISSICTLTNMEAIEFAMENYHLYYPTVDDCLSIVKYSTQLYWEDNKAMFAIKEYLSKLTKIQRAAFAYVGDLFHLSVYNKEFISSFILALAERKKTEIEIDNSLEELGKYHADIVALSSAISADVSRGKDIFETDMTKEKVISNLERSHIVACAKNIHTVLEQHRVFIRAFFVTPNIPGSVATLPQSIRRAALISDTDSTLFTVKRWTEWLLGEKHPLNDRRMAVASTVIFLASQTITHILAMISANLGVIKEKIHRIAMKNEYFFNPFITTSITKHYAALKEVQEGVVYAKPGPDLKGAHIITSKAPKEIRSRVKNLFIDIMEEVKTTVSVDVNKVITRISDTEHYIYNCLKQGDQDYFQRAKVKDKFSYKNPDNFTPYSHYEFWEEVFAPKYGTVDPPPFGAIKLTANIKNKSDMERVINAIEDDGIKERFKNYLEKKNKKVMKSFLIPDQIVRAQGLPVELLSIINSREIVAENCRAFYILLESLGIYMQNNGTTRLVSDYYHASKNPGKAMIMDQ